MSAITAKASRKMKKYAVLTREPRCFLGSFDFSWEQRKFEEIAVRSSVICSDDTLPRVEYEDIVSGTGRLNKDIYAKQSSKSGIAFHQGDVLYGKLRPYLQNWLLPTFDGLAVGDFWVLQPQNADSSFLYRLIQSRQFDEVANQSTGTKMPRADWKLVSKTVFSIPSNISEQAAIGTYFTALDNLITLHQRKCVFLFGLFQASISMIFTASTFSWEQRKFADVVQIERGGSPRPIDDYITDSPNGLNWVKIGDAPSQGHYITKTAERIRPQGLSKTREVHPGDLILSNSMSFGKPYIMGIDGCIHDGWLLIRDTNNTFDLTFLCHLLGTPQMLDQYRSLAAGSTVNNLNKELVGNTVVTIPKIDEQRVLGQYLERLDNLITLHQRECISFTVRAGGLILTANKKRTTSSWEQRKLGDIGKARSGVGFPDAEQGGVTGIPFFKVSDMNLDGNENEMTVANNYVTAEQIAVHRWSPITELPAIFFAKVGAAVMLNRKRLCRFPFLLDNNTMAYSLSSTKWDADFAKALFGTVDLTSLVQVGALPSYNAGDVESMEIYLPSLLEQEQIGGFFKQLDTLITLHQRKPFLMKWRTSDANRNQTNRLVL